MTSTLSLPSHLKSLPKQWDVCRLKFSLRERDLRSESGDEELFSLSKTRGLLPRSEITEKEARAESLQGYKRFLSGDIVMNKMQAWNGVFGWSGIRSGIVSPDYTVLTPDESVHGPYLTYLFQTGTYCTEFLLRSRGMGDAFLRLNTSELGEVFAPVPLLEEQIAIAAYLDAETKRIDELIREKTDLLRTLDLLFNSVITDAVTRGLNSDVRRSSEPEHSLFDFPAHWIRCGLIKKIESIVDYRGKTPEKTESGVFLVTARNIADGWIDYAKSAEFIAEGAYEEVMLRGKPEIGDVLFTTEAPLGKVASVDRTDIALAQRIIKFRGDSQYLENDFLKYWLMSEYMQDQLKTWSSGSTADGIKASRLRRLQILIPPLHEQSLIVKFIDKKLAEVRELRLHVENDLVLLSEYRSSTITDAVLGRIDVRKANSH